MKRTKMDGEPERRFTTALIVSGEVCKAVGDFNQKLLSSQYSKTVAKWSIEYYKKYDRPIFLDIKTVFNEKKSEIACEETRELIASYVRSLSKDFENGKYEDVTEPFMVDEAHKFLRQQTEKIYLNQIQAAVENGEDIAPIQEAYKPYTATSMLPPMDNANELIQRELPKAKYLIDGLFGWGLIFFVGTHKIGKSFAMLQIAEAVATGGLLFGKYKVRQREVIYMCLEDGPERIQKRLLDFGYNEEDLSKLHFIYESRKGTEGLADLALRLQQAPKTKLVIIDALATFRGNAKNKNLFQAEYDALFEIKKFASAHKICIIIVHHQNKPGKNGIGPTDIVDTINGTQGLGAAVDQTFILTRARKSQDGKLYTTSRDLPEQDLAMHVSLPHDGWTVVGDADAVDTGIERKAILYLLEENGTMGTGQIARALGKALPTISILLSKLADDGFIKKIGYGKYEYVS